MGHFIISLDDNRKGDVERGTIRRTLKLKDLFKKNKPDSVTAYRIVMDANAASRKEYYLYKSKEGQWFEDAEQQLLVRDAFLLALKRAIIQKELELSGC
jgi:hypothetical protein